MYFIVNILSDLTKGFHLQNESLGYGMCRMIFFVTAGRAFPDLAVGARGGVDPE
jgi:hypothetical protein